MVSPVPFLMLAAAQAYVYQSHANDPRCVLTGSSHTMNELQDYGEIYIEMSFTFLILPVSWNQMMS